MAKKADLLEKAKALKLNLTEKNTIAEIEQAIADAEHHEVREATVAKAGKRSQKAIDEAKAAEEKAARKDAGDTSAQDPDAVETKKKGPTPITRPRVDRRGKKYQEAAKLVDKNKEYTLSEAVSLATNTKITKFDASVEIHVRLGVDPRQADQNIRATVALPNGSGKTIRVAVFAPEDTHAAAKKAGADIVGDEDFLKLLDKEKIEFDVLVATPQYMAKLGKYARLLGPRGLMPNPKSGTVSADPAKSVTEAKAGKVEYRVDKQAVVHLAVGKVSFGTEKIEQNIKAFIDSLGSQKPSSIKGVFIKSISISTTMGPGIRVEI
jgi:large subunit ribosomal protein L1